MTNVVRFICMGLTIMFAWGCASKKVADEVATGCVPADLKVKVADRAMTVIFTPSCDQLISGYYIYISEEPLTAYAQDTLLPGTIRPFNLTAFSGDTNPDDGVEYFDAERLENGKKYFVSVRTIFPGRTLSRSSAEIPAVCGPRGEMQLSIRYKSDRDGFSFEQNGYVSADNLANDLYFFSKDGKDFLASPVRLDGFLRDNRLMRLAFKGEYEQVKSRVMAAGEIPDQERIEVKKGNWVLLYTADKRFALLKVLEFSGEGEKRVIRLFYAYSALEDEIFF